MEVKISVLICMFIFLNLILIIYKSQYLFRVGMKIKLLLSYLPK